MKFYAVKICPSVFFLCLCGGLFGQSESLLPATHAEREWANMAFVNVAAILHPRGLTVGYQRAFSHNLAIGSEFGFGFPERKDFHGTRLFPQEDLVRTVERFFTVSAYGRYYFSGVKKWSWFVDALALYYHDSISMSNGDCAGCQPTAERSGSALLTGFAGGAGFGYSFVFEDVQVLAGVNVAAAQARRVAYQVRDLATGETSLKFLEIGSTEYGFSARIMLGAGLMF
jgi:hypothetical protein